MEVSQAMTGIAGNKGLNFVTTGHIRAKEPGMTELLKKQLLHGYTIRELNHSHPREKLQVVIISQNQKEIQALKRV